VEFESAVGQRGIPERQAGPITFRPQRKARLLAGAQFRLRNMSDHGPRKHAEDCVDRANKAPSTLEKTLHLLMADAWMKLAHAGERRGADGQVAQAVGKR
jgi:hypothetical protein